MTMNFMECKHIFVLSWKRNLTKRDCNLKTIQIIYIIPLGTSFLEKVGPFSQNFDL